MRKTTELPAGPQEQKKQLLIKKYAKNYKIARRAAKNIIYAHQAAVRIALRARRRPVWGRPLAAGGAPNCPVSPAGRVRAIGMII